MPPEWREMSPRETESKHTRTSAKKHAGETQALIFKKMAHTTGFEVASDFTGAL